MGGLKAVSDWIAATPASVLIQKNEVWAIPTIQSIHIAAIGVVLASVLAMTLRLFGVAQAERTVLQTQARFGPWLTGALWLLLLTGTLMIIGEPERELVTFSFWVKMALVAVGVAIAWAFQRSVRRRGAEWDERLAGHGSVRALAVLTLLIWLAVIVMGRLIAYDHVWGALSPATKA